MTQAPLEGAPVQARGGARKEETSTAGTQPRTPTVDTNPQQEGTTTMPEQTTAEKLRDLGINRASRAADPDWKQAAEATLDQFIARGEPFTATEVRAAMPPGYVTRDARAMGGIMTRAVNAGHIRHVGYAKSTDPKHHCAIVNVFQATSRVSS